MKDYSRKPLIMGEKAVEDAEAISQHRSPNIFQLLIGHVLDGVSLFALGWR
jgi:hypothetical protein